MIDSATGSALSGATITVQQIPAASALSDGTGQFVLAGLPPGTYTVLITAPGHAPSMLEISVRAGMTVDAGSVALPSAVSAGTLAGRVSDSASGAPLGGVLIAVTGAGTGKTYTLADGTYSLPGLAPGAVQVAASKNGYQGAAAQGTIVAGGTLSFSPALEPVRTTAALSGQIVDATTLQPLAGVTVSIAQLNLATTTGTDGRFVLAGIGGDLLKVDLAAAGYSASSFTFSSEAGTNVDARVIRLYKTSEPASGATIQGEAVAAETGLPVAGVLIQASGTATLSATSAADGSYSIAALPPGLVSFSASKQGYVTKLGSGTVTAGATLVFSPRLEAAIVPGVRGSVIDNVTLTSLAGVRVSLAGKTMSTEQGGAFLLAGVETGNHTLTLEAPGYTTRRLPVFATTGGSTEVGVVKLAPASQPIVVSGKVSDASTGQPLARAEVTILGTAFHAVANEQGAYRIEGVPQGSATVRYSAPGYLSETVIFSLSPYDTVAQDRALSSGQTSALALAVATDLPQYPAYSPVAFKTTVDNMGAATGAGVLSVAIFDADDRYLDSFKASRVDASGATQSTFEFTPGATLLDLRWNTVAHPPGRYSAIVRIHSADAGSASAAIELAQRRVSFDILPSAAIGSVAITPLPSYSNVGASEQLGYRIDVVNRSNVPVEGNLRFTLKGPDLVTIDGAAFTLALTPAESSKSFVLPGVAHAFQKSGLYRATLQALNGVLPAVLSGGQISVAPGTRIQPIQTVTPASVAPDGPKKISIDLRLQGIELK